LDLKLILRCLLPIAVLAGIVLETRADRRPNLVLILADDLGYETVGCFGGTSYQTPHLDRLAAEGMRFDRAYAMPLCTNTRIQLMTGKYNSRNWKAFGILDPNELTFGQLLQQAGYETCIAGKWQLTSYDPPDYPGADLRRNTGTHPRDAGFDEYSLWHVGHTEDKGSRYADPVIEQNGKRLLGTKGKYGPDIWTDFINDFITRNQAGPFFVYYSMALPHNPMVPTPDSPAWQDPQRRHSDETPFAAAMIEYTDKMVGKVVDHLDSLQLDRDTLVLFYSDNGTNWRVTSRFGERMVRGGKGKGTELGIRVPAIARWVGKIESGTVSEALFDSVDVLPTLLDAAGAAATIPDDLDGVSLCSHMTEGAPGPRSWVYIHQDPRPGWDKDRFQLIRLALGQRFKLYEDGRLFDLQSDPFEQSPRFCSGDDGVAGKARLRLQHVLDSMKPYPHFDPDTVPRPNPRAASQDFRFQDQGGYVVMEAEQLPFPRDESWWGEAKLPGYRGLGYLRGLRDQASVPQLGQTHVGVIVDNAGPWRVAVRCRSDHPSARERTFWFKAGQREWSLVGLPEEIKPGQWVWLDPLSGSSPPGQVGSTIQLQERGNDFWIAPATANFKIDRIVVYEHDRATRALDLQTPVSDYHPWASP
jgi:arylsulfatase A-like enzyme